jgi:hypothetical protein
MSFDSASSDYIDVGNDVSLQFSSSFTISAWVKIDLNDTGNNAIISKDSSASNGAGYHISFRTGNSVHAWSYDANSKLTATGLTTNTWYHIVFIFESTGGSNGNQSLYINAGTPVTNTITNFAASTIKNLRIGESEVLSGYNTNGQIDAVSIYNYALSSSQVTTLYGSSSTGIGNPMSLSPKPVAFYQLGDKSAFNGANYLVPNIAAEEADGDIASSYSPYALEFDAASNDKITASSNSNFNTGDLSASIWINASNLGNNIKYFFGNSNALATAGFTFSVNTSTGNAWYIGRATTTHMYVINNVSINFTNNVWNHLCFSYDDTTKGFILYLNGASVNSGTATSNTKNASGSIIFGGHNVNYDLTGKLSNASIWNTALTSAQVTEIYSEGIPQNLLNHSAVSSLVSWWQLGSNSSFNTNWTVLDEKGSNNGTSSNMGEDAIVYS